MSAQPAAMTAVSRTPRHINAPGPLQDLTMLLLLLLLLLLPSSQADCGG
jgi:hypothetical protein